MLNKVILMGRLCADPELKSTTSGVSVCRFRIAVNRPYKKDAEEQQADFISVSCWRQTAEFVGRFFSKGKMIIVEGALRNNDYTDGNGVKHYSMEVLAQNVMFGESKGSNEPSDAQASPQRASTASAGMSRPSNTTPAQTGGTDAIDISDFEEILGEGEMPF